jgi:hypothetical protein
VPGDLPGRYRLGQSSGVPAPGIATVPPRGVGSASFTVERYFALVDEGVLSEDDRVELLEGVVVAMAPRNAPHDAGICRATEALRTIMGHDVVIRVQSALVLGPRSVSEPDVAVVPGPMSA